MLASILPSALACLLALAPSYFVGSPPTAADCVGDACAAVAVKYDESKGQYRVQNNSADSWVRVTASNMAASASVCVAPGKSDHMPLKSIVGSYRADRSSSCGGGSGT